MIAGLQGLALSLNCPEQWALLTAHPHTSHAHSLAHAYGQCCFREAPSAILAFSSLDCLPNDANSFALFKLQPEEKIVVADGPFHRPLTIKTLLRPPIAAL
jgi:hypothetical protein